MWTLETRIEPTPAGRHANDALRRARSAALESREQAIVEVVLLNSQEQAALAKLKREVAELRRTVAAQKETIYALECTMSRMDERRIG